MGDRAGLLTRPVQHREMGDRAGLLTRPVQHRERFRPLNKFYTVNQSDIHK
jgi:hypothetical protein